MTENQKKRMPRSFDVDTEPAKTDKATDQKPKTRRPKSVAASQVKVSVDEVDFFDAEIEAEQNVKAFKAVEKRRQRYGFSFFGIAKWATGLLLTLAFGLWLESLWREAFSRNDWLGWTVSGLIALFVVGMLGMALREWLAIRQIKQVSRMRDEAKQAIEDGNSAQLRTSALALGKHFSNDSKTAAGRAKLSSLHNEIVDGEDLYALYERELLQSLDQTAISKISASAKRVSIVTAVSPRALVDVGYVLFENMRLIRSMAELYGGRAGGLGTLTLARRVITHLAITGAISVSEGLMQQFLGQGLAARISTRLGEGVFNGLMTARVGIAAMEVCRPAPFFRLPRPKISDFLPRLMPAKKPDEEV
ncbi:MAG: TIGR01620 family protein [Pseudomonadota bacterium]